MNNYPTNQSFITTMFALVGLCMSACSNEGQHQMQIHLQNEFIETYTYVTQHYSVKNNLAVNFFNMKSINSDAFSSIAYRWHNLAIDECQISASKSSHSQRSSYEKMLSNKDNKQQIIEINNEEDRSCLAKIYRSNWEQINNMLIFNFPNIK